MILFVNLFFRKLLITPYGHLPDELKIYQSNQYQLLQKIAIRIITNQMTLSANFHLPLTLFQAP